MMAKNWYRYTTDDGHVYDLGAEFMRSAGRIRLICCDIHKESGEYVGNWMRENMPVSLIRSMEHWLAGDAANADLSMRAKRWR